MKRIKMLLYGEPGVGKSVFASKAPKPFFITTDGNYEWLEDFGADPNAHIQVSSWSEAKAAFAKEYAEYETIVIDLLEDLFKWCEYEFCTRSKIEHVSDVGYGKGYDISRNEFFLEIAKLLGKDKHIILITHGITFTTKDRRGVEHTKYAPSSRIPDKVLDMIEGRLRYCLRCYLKAEEQTDGTILKKRFLSLVPKENEFGIIRGVDENIIPHDIPLDFEEFAKVIGLNSVKSEPVQRPQPETTKRIEKQTKEVVEKTSDKAEMLDNQVTAPSNEDVKVDETNSEQVKNDAQVSETKTDIVEENAPNVEKPVEQPQQVEENKPLSNADKLAAIKAKLARINAQNKQGE